MYAFQTIVDNNNDNNNNIELHDVFVCVRGRVLIVFIYFTCTVWCVLDHIIYVNQNHFNLDIFIEWKRTESPNTYTYTTNTGRRTQTANKKLGG